jgi:guanine deaminase
VRPAYPEAAIFSIRYPGAMSAERSYQSFRSGLYSVLRRARGSPGLAHVLKVPGKLPSTLLEFSTMENPFMARAIQLSIDNVVSGQGGPFGAVIVRNGDIVAEGVNRVTADKDPTAHAEMVAIRQACGKLRVFELMDCEIYTSCEPCPMCLGAIYWARLARVYFGNLASDASKIGFDDSFIYQEIAEVLRQRSIPMIPMMREQALAAFRAWEAKPNKILY